MARKKKNQLVRWIVIISIVLAIGVSIFLYLAFSGNNKAINSENNLPQTYTVEKVSFSESIEVSGNIQPIQSQDLSFTIGGEITAILVKQGDFVKKGSLIARLDDTQEAYDLAALDFDIEEEELIGSEQTVELMELQRKVKLKALNNTRLYAGISGKISKVNFETGAYIKAGDIICRIIDTSSLVAGVEIDELDVPSVKLNQKVIFHFDALPDLQVAGRVSALPIEGRVTSQGIAVLDAEVRIDNPPPAIIPLYSFTAEIIVSQEESILVLDKRAIIERGEQTIVMLSSEDNSEPKPQRIETRPYSEDKVRIVSGLAAGDVVLSMQNMIEQSGEQRPGGMMPFRMFGGGGNRR